MTNGEIVGDALTAIEEYSDDWVNRGYPKLKIWRRGDLLSMFITSHGSYLPTALADFREFVQLYVSHFEDRLPREKFALFPSESCDGGFS